MASVLREVGDTWKFGTVQLRLIQTPYESNKNKSLVLQIRNLHVSTLVILQIILS
jgi:hypothetical protein